MKSFLKLRLVTFFVLISQTITACHGGLHSQIPPPQSSEITATFTAEGYTLSLATSCKSAVQKCPFRAEILASPALFALIEKVEYTFLPDRPKSPAPITDAATQFRFEAEQTAGGKLYAAVRLRPRDGAPPKVVRIEGTIPFAAEVTPPLPAGLRFEIQCQPWYLEGVPHQPVEYIFKIQLRGEACRTQADPIRRVPASCGRRQTPAYHPSCGERVFSRRQYAESGGRRYYRGDSMEERRDINVYDPFAPAFVRRLSTHPVVHLYLVVAQIPRWLAISTNPPYTVRAFQQYQSTLAPQL